MAAARTATKTDNSSLYFADGTKVDSTKLKRHVNAYGRAYSALQEAKSFVKDVLDKAKDDGFAKKRIKRADELKRMSVKDRAAELQDEVTLSIAMDLCERDLLGELIQTAGSKPPEAPEEDGDEDSGDPDKAAFD